MDISKSIPPSEILDPNRALSRKAKTKQRRVLKGIGAPRTRVINRCISLSRRPDVESEEEGKGEHIRRSTEEREVAGTITIIAIELPIPLFDGWRSLRRLGYVCLLSQAGKEGGEVWVSEKPCSDGAENGKKNMSGTTTTHHLVS